MTTRIASRNTLVMVLGLLIGTLVADPARARPPVSSAPLDASRVNAFVAGQVRRSHLPGLALGIVEGSRVLDLKGFGSADTGRPVTPQTPFLLASVSKPLTATAVMQLVESGQVDLDTAVQRYVPEFRMADAAADRITVRQLMQHTSGIPLTSCDTREDAQTLAQFVAELRTVHLAAQPGARHSYCSGNYNVLGRMVELVSGEPFAAYMQRHVFTPLAMRNSFGSVADARAAGLAQGHRWLFGLVTAKDERYNTSQLPSGFLISSAEDMTHFLVAQLNGGRFRNGQVLSAAGVAAMQAPGVPAGAGARYGLGWKRAPLGGVPVIQHSGDNFYFHTMVFMDPATRRGAVILVNGNGALPFAVGLAPIEAGVARLLAGREPGPATRLSLPVAYLLLDLVLAIPLGLALLALARLPRWARRLRAARLAGHGRRWRTGLRVAAEIVLPVALLALVRFLIGTTGAQSWSEILALLPDTGAWLWTISALVVVTGAARLLLAIRTTRRDGHETRAPTG